ncbi:single-stranded DNA-binding protein [Lentisphaerota bacterium WC36G]|nr:single-stranded DNA-binding protein [Lentisphaerae bacterium WC36]
MASLNKVLLMGNLTREPSLRHTPSGMAVCDLGLAINRRFTSSNNEQRDETCFVDVVVWGKQAESCGRYLEKGSAIFVEGRLQLDQWQDRESGQNRSRLRVVAERVQFMSNRNNASSGTNVNADNTYSNNQFNNNQQQANSNQFADNNNGFSNQQNSSNNSGPFGNQNFATKGGAPAMPDVFDSSDIEDDIPF